MEEVVEPFVLLITISEGNGVVDVGEGFRIITIQAPLSIERLGEWLEERGRAPQCYVV